MYIVDSISSNSASVLSDRLKLLPLRAYLEAIHALDSDTRSPPPPGAPKAKQLFMEFIEYRDNELLDVDSEAIRSPTLARVTREFQAAAKVAGWRRLYEGSNELGRKRTLRLLEVGCAVDFYTHATLNNISLWIEFTSNRPTFALKFSPCLRRPFFTNSSLKNTNSQSSSFSSTRREKRLVLILVTEIATG